MDRKTMFATGGAVLMTVVAASSAMAVNLGILDDSTSDKVGQFQVEPTTVPSSTTVLDNPEVIHITVRDLPPVTTAPAPAPAVAAAPSPTAAPMPSAAPAATPRPAVEVAPTTTVSSLPTRTGDDDDEHEDDDHVYVPNREHEGRDDDD